jgi:hypothetical protein
VGIKWGGRTWLAEPMRLWALASAEQFCLIHREHPLDRVSRTLEALAGRPSLAKHLSDMATADMRRDRKTRMVQVAELEHWLETLPGVAYSAWCMLSKVNPACLCLEDVEAHVETMSREELSRFCRARDMAAGMDVLASLDWRGRADDEKLVRPERLKKRREEEARRGPKYIPWRRIFRFFATEYGWGPDQVGMLTFWHVKLYTAEEAELGGVQSLTPGESMGFRAQRREMNAMS